MDKDEYKAYRDTVNRMAKQEKERKENSGSDTYNPRWMNLDRMPLGCFLMSLGFLAFIGYVVYRMITR